MQCLPFYVRENIYPFLYLYSLRPQVLPSPGDCQSRLAFYQTFKGGYALGDKIKTSLVTNGQQAISLTLFYQGKLDSHTATVKKSYINITETKDNKCRSLPLNLRSGTHV